MKNLELRIFRFDKQKDYEAYYKPYVYNIMKILPLFMIYFCKCKMMIFILILKKMIKAIS